MKNRDNVYLKVEYVRKDAKEFKSVIEIKESVVDGLRAEFGSVKGYLNSIITGGVIIKDNYLFIKEA